jgi:hypothetical protein
MDPMWEHFEEASTFAGYAYGCGSLFALLSLAAFVSSAAVIWFLRR